MSLAQQEALDGLENVTVVSATRTSGEGTYSDAESGVIGAGDLLPQKARILLQLALTFTDDRAQVGQWFATIGDREFDLRPPSTEADDRTAPSAGHR